MMRRVSRGARDERGATAIVVALVSIVLFGAAAVGVDIANLTMERQELHDAVDAAAQAAAYDLPGTGAATTATTFAKFNDPDANPTSTLYCVIAATGGNTPTIAQVPSTCDPDGNGTFVNSGWSCARGICAKKCSLTATNAKCNTVRVEAKKDVPFMFAPVIGYDKGNTGVVVSAACKGSCGTETPNPLDIVIMADRTASMPAADRAQMKQAILNSLVTMDSSMHHVAFGALAKSRETLFTSASVADGAAGTPPEPTYENCSVYPWYSSQRTACNNRNQDKQDAYNDAVTVSKSIGWTGSGDTNGDGLCKTEAVRLNGRSASGTRSEGTWVPVDFSKDYINSAKQLNYSSALVDAVNCLPESASGEYGTNLGASLKAAVRKVMVGSNLPGASSRPGTVRKVVIFETDGQPDEVGNATGSTAVTNDEEVWSGQQSDDLGENGCNRFKQVAENAKAQGILIITIGFGGAATADCRKSSAVGSRVRDVLASAASKAPDGSASTAGDCASSAGIAAENADGDYFFCAAQGGELANIFKTALTQLSKGIKLVNLP